MHPKYIDCCRVCGSKHLVDVVDLGEQCLQGAFFKEGVTPPPRRKLPTRLVRCDVTKQVNGCGLVQLAHTFPPEVLYSNYWYRSGTNQTMRDHLGGIVESVLGISGFKDGDNINVLDIGCNDGTLLSCYPDSAKRYGVDPSDIAREASAEHNIHLANTVFPSEQAAEIFGDTRFEIVTSIAMFYDLDDPIDFARGIKGVLSDKGIWVLEMSYMPLMLKRNSFDTICHEHLEYYSLSVLEYIFRSSGLRVFKIEINEINGGSIRCYVSHARRLDLCTPENDAYIRKFRMLEFDLALDTEKPYAEFRQKIEHLRGSTRALLYELRKQGKRIHIYGASTKGNVLLQWYGIDNILVDVAADRNPDKDGAYTLGSNIPIVSEKKSRNMKPDYYLVLPWHFKSEFLQRERRALEEGVKFIFPLPTLDVIGLCELDEDALAREGHQSIGAAALEAILWGP